MKIIDFERKGNVIKFYLGEDSLKNWTGDDWNDRPYEHNAGLVYEEYISGTEQIALKFEDVVREPADDYLNSNFCKDDMKERKVPCLVIEKNCEVTGWGDIETFESLVCKENSIKIYFGDSIDEVLEKINSSSI